MLNVDYEILSWRKLYGTLPVDSFDKWNRNCEFIVYGDEIWNSISVLNSSIFFIDPIGSHNYL